MAQLLARAGSVSRRFGSVFSRFGRYANTTISGPGLWRLRLPRVPPELSRPFQAGWEPFGRGQPVPTSLKLGHIGLDIGAT